MNKLIRCKYCDEIIKFEEMGIKDKDLGFMCKECHDWLHKEFLPLYRGEKPCLQ